MIEGKIEIIGKTVGQHVIGRFVALETAAGGFGEIHRERICEEDAGQAGRYDEPGLQVGVHCARSLFTDRSHVISDTDSRPAFPSRSAREVSSIISRRARPPLSARSRRSRHVRFGSDPGLRPASSRCRPDGLSNAEAQRRHRLPKYRREVSGSFDTSRNGCAVQNGEINSSYRNAGSG